MTFQTQTIRLESFDSDKENQSPTTTNEVASETLCDPGFGTVWPSSLLFSSSSNFTAAASPIPLPSFVSPTNPPTFALLPSQLPPDEQFTPVTLDLNQGVLKANVYEPGYVSFMLKNDIVVNIGPNYAVQIVNPTVDIKLALSGCATQMALIHPQGRVLQYMARVEVQCLGSNGVDKSAKLWPRGISFTSSNCAITYLVDEAGTRSTSDYFYNLFFEDNTDSKQYRVS